MEKNYLGCDIPKLGFGLMRLPMIGSNVDMEQTKAMVDHYMGLGFTYYDTAYVYINGTSEVAAREALVKRYPRESFQLATKLAVWNIHEEKDLEEQFNTSRERAGVEYFDFYLLHALNEERIDHVEKFDMWGFIAKKKEQGQIKHIGFSFHDTPEALDKILTAHPEAEFVQLQINYADWEAANVQSRGCYEVAMKHNTPVIIMEPVKGGSLAAMTPEIQDIFKAANPELSVPSWAIRYAASLDGIITVLSGMSTFDQLKDNTSYMADFKPLDAEERKVIDKVVGILNKTETIPCTGCKYCVEDCPKNINIPDIFNAYNTYKVYNNLPGSLRSYGFATKEGSKASDCLHCGSCESHCPQHISIMDELEKVAAALEK